MQRRAFIRAAVGFEDLELEAWVILGLVSGWKVILLSVVSTYGDAEDDSLKWVQKFS